MFLMDESISIFPLVPLGEHVEVLDRLRKPINNDVRRTRIGNIPYFGANGQVGTIDEWIFNEDLVLVAEDGGFFEDNYRPISYKISGKSWVNNHAHVLRPLPSVDIDWLNYSIGFQDIRSFIKGATLKKLNQSELKKLKIPLPAIEEQRRIVARIKECMERVEEMEGLRIKAIEETQVLAEKSFGRVLEGNGFPLKPVGDLVENTRNGRSIKPSSENSSGFVLGLGSVRGVILSNSSLKPIILPDGVKDKYAIREGDVYVSRANTRELVGLSSFADKDFPNCIFPDLLIQLRPKLSEIHPLYMAFALRSPAAREQIKAVASGTSQSMVKISGKKLKEIVVPVPPLANQLELLEKLKAVQDGLDEILAGMSACNFSALRDAILRKAFAGEL